MEGLSKLIIPVTTLYIGVVSSLLLLVGTFYSLMELQKCLRTESSFTVQ